MITRLEALDQSNGTGGIVYWVDEGVNRRRVGILFIPSEHSHDREIDFIVNIYGEPVISNDLIEGDLNESHFKLHT